MGKENKNDYYTFIKDAQLPQTICSRDQGNNSESIQEMIQKHAYSKCTIMGKNNNLICIAPDMLKYNIEDVDRQSKSMFACGYFIVHDCKLFNQVHGQHLEDFDIQI